MRQGSGKGTHCNKLMEFYDIAMIGTGDLLRWNVDNQTEVGKVAEEYICKGGQSKPTLQINLVHMSHHDAYPVYPK